MILIKTILGNTGDPEWAGRLSSADIDLIEIDQWEAAHFREDGLRSVVKVAKKRYEDALRLAFFGL